jgi:hypothetical protein
MISMCKEVNKYWYIKRVFFPIQLSKYGLQVIIFFKDIYAMAILQQKLI